MANCPDCPDCCNEPCFEQLECVYSCGPCCHFEVVPAASLDLLAGTIMAQRDEDGKWAAYDPDAVNGLQYPRGVLKFTTVTNADGRVTNIGNTFAQTGCTPYTTNVYYEGTFNVADTYGNLAAALGNPAFGRMLEGAVAGPGVWKLV